MSIDTIESHSISSKSTAEDMKDNECQSSNNFKLPKLNIANIVVQNDLFTGLCVEDGFSASQMCPIDIDADDNFSMALDSDVSRSSETTSGRESVSSYFFNSPQTEKEDTAKQFEIGISSIRLFT